MSKTTKTKGKEYKGVLNFKNKGFKAPINKQVSEIVKN
jgi:hypothetical protein